ncbi:MAG: hypothetical protein ACR2P7_01805 [bacterium]
MSARSKVIRRTIISMRYAIMSKSIPSAPFALAALVLFAALGAPADSEAARLQHFIHEASGKCIHPVDRDIRRGTKLVVDGERHKRTCKEPGTNTLAFRYEAKRKRLVHPYTTLCAMPESRQINPNRRAKLILHECRDPSAEFEYHLGKHLRHVSGMCVHILPGRGTNVVRPNDGASLILDDGCRGTRTTWNSFRLDPAPERQRYTKLVHKYSGMCAMPDGFRSSNNTRIKLVTRGCDDITAEYEEMYFQLLPNGAIFHPFSGKCLHRQRNKLAFLVLHDGCERNDILFRHLETGALQHRESGYCIYPPSGRALVPAENGVVTVAKKAEESCVGKFSEFEFQRD